MRHLYDVIIIGGGPGGMRTAIYLADRGHKVTIYEAEGELGGAIRHSDYIPFKWTLKDYKDFLIHQVSKRDIKVVLNTRVTPDMVAGRYDRRCGRPACRSQHSRRGRGQRHCGD